MNMMKSQNLLEKVRNRSIALPASGRRFIIFSDTHLGDGGRSDDFKKNSGIFLSALEYYFKRDYTLILNGDIEELCKFPMRKIEKQWKAVYNILDRFQSEGRLYKITGNHDEALIRMKSARYPALESITITGLKYPFLIFHGHQVTGYYNRFNRLNEWLLRLFVLPLGIRNYSKAHESLKQFNVERVIYNYSKQNSLISIIGHTHRPLFESMTKPEYMKMRIEQQLRKLLRCSPEEKPKVEAKIAELLRALNEWKSHNASRRGIKGSIYSEEVPIPCLFNSGCVIGKRGITGIELTENEIGLIQWINSSVGHQFRYTKQNDRLPVNQVRKITIRKRPLEYIFNCIRLFSKDPVQ